MTLFDLNPFISAYIDAALADMEEKDLNRTQLDPETLEKVQADCEKFIRENVQDLEGLDAAMAGMNFWLTRNWHGTGYWDRDLGELGDRLAAASHKFGEAWWYLEDRNRSIYQIP